MSANGLVPIEVAISAAASGTFASGAENDQSLSYNPAFQVGSGTYSASPSASPTASQSASSNPSSSAGASASVAPPGSGTTAAAPSLTSALNLGSINPEYIWLGLGLVLLVMIMPSGGGRRR